METSGEVITYWMCESYFRFGSGVGCNAVRCFLGNCREPLPYQEGDPRELLQCLFGLDFQRILQMNVLDMRGHGDFLTLC